MIYNKEGQCSECTAMENCTAECAAMPKCGQCSQTKGPRGRSAGLMSSYCDCRFEYDDPKAGHLWPDEWRRHEAGHPAESDYL